MAAPAPAGQICEACFGPLDIELTWPVAVDRGAIAAGPASMWRYRDLLPVMGHAPAGWTPLVRSEALGDALGLHDLWLKDERANPTGSFKDRLVATAVARATAESRSVLACSSTGNLARSVLAAAAASGVAAVVLVPAGGVAVPGTIAVRGGYDAVNRLSAEAAMAYDGWAWVNVGLRPWYVEGAATLAYETAEQLGWQAPDRVVATIASGASLLRLHRAFTDLHRAGLLEHAPSVTLTAAQPSGCAPVARAFASGATRVAPVRPATAVRSVAMGDPPEGDDVLAAARASGGDVVSVPESSVAGASALLVAAAGMDADPAVGVAVAAVAMLVRAGRIDPDDRVVLYVTAAAAAAPVTAPVTAPVSSQEPATTIEPTLEALAAVLPEHVKEARA